MSHRATPRSRSALPPLRAGYIAVLSTAETADRHLEQRVEALERELAAPLPISAALPSASTASASAAAATAKALARAEYRILHLVRGLGAATARAEAAEKELAELKRASGPAAAR